MSTAPIVLPPDLAQHDLVFLEGVEVPAKVINLGDSPYNHRGHVYVDLPAGEWQTTVPYDPYGNPDWGRVTKGLAAPPRAIGYKRVASVEPTAVAKVASCAAPLTKRPLTLGLGLFGIYALGFLLTLHYYGQRPGALNDNPRETYIAAACAAAVWPVFYPVRGLWRLTKWVTAPAPAATVEEKQP